MNINITKDEFDKLILEDIYTCDHIIPGTVYFDDEYAHGLGRYLGKEHEDRVINEFKDLGQGRTKICSVASSARLCALYFANNNISRPRPLGEFEKCFPIKGTVGVPPHMDYYSHDTNTCYECKCHEILDDHNSDKLKFKYYFFIKEILGHDVKHDNQFIYLTLRDLGLDSDTSIYDLHFNVKQLFTHIMGLLSDKNKTQHKLQYVFFTPNRKEPKVKDLYSVLNSEIELLKKSSLIKYAHEHDVLFLDPIFVEVKDIYDHALALTRDKETYVNTAKFDRILFSYIEKDYVPSVSDIQIEFDSYTVPEALAFRVQYNLLLIKSKDFDYNLGFEAWRRSIDQDEHLFYRNSLIDICTEFQVTESIGKLIYDKFIFIRDEKEADAVFSNKK